MFSELLNRVGRTAVAAVAALALLFWAGEAQAQQGAITGQVVDASNLEPVVGAQVFVPGTDLGGLTNEEGRYRITGVPAGQTTVRVRLLGYRPTSKTVSVDGGETATLNFQLSVSAVALEEVVVTATGERRQRELGSAISTVNAAEAVQQSSPNNLTNLLKGRSTGVSVQRSSGSVGTGDVIKIRGNTSIGLSNVPLIYIDGARVDNDNSTGPGTGGQTASRLNDLNPDDIESIEIIKGPSAAALYGTDAAAGVIRIETKSGSASGDTRYSFRVESGVNRPFVGNYSGTYINAQNLFGTSIDPGPFLGVAPPGVLPSVAVPDTLYQMNLVEPQIRPSPDLAPGYADMFRDGYVQTYGGSVRGGSEFVTYYVSGEFNAEDGNLDNNAFDKYNARANFNLNPSDKFDISVSTGFTSNFLSLPDNDNNGFGYLGVAKLGFPFFTPFRRGNFVDGGVVTTCMQNFEVARVASRAGLSGLFADALGESLLANLGQCPPAGLSGRTFDDIATIQNQQHIERFTGSATGTYRPFDFMTNRVTIGYDEVTNDQPELVPVDPDRPFATASEGSKFTFQEEKRNLTLEATSTLNFELTENLNSQTTIGGQWFKEVNEGTFSSGQTLPPGCTTVSCAVTTTGGETFSEERTLGVFAQEQLSWKDRIFLTPAIRFDDNSAFGENLDVQQLPSVSFSWIMSEEDWFPGLFDQFRLRGAWGKAGLQPGTTDALRLLNQVSVTLQGQSLPGLTVTDPGNPQLAPETTTEWEGGFDASLLDGRLSLQATYYHQTTEDAIVFQSLQPSFGFPGNRPANIGEIVSQGFEFGVDATAVDVPNLTWNWGVNLSTNDGEITRLNRQIVFGLGGASQRHRQGFPFSGYWSSSFDTQGGQVVCTGPVDGCQDGDLQFLGHPTPEWQGSVSTTFTLFDRLSLYSLLDFAGGHHLFNATEEFHCGFLGLDMCGEIHERNDNGSLTDAAQAKRLAVEVGEETPWIEQADYAKLRTVSLRFQLPESWVQPISAHGASLSLVGENLATFTGYSGMDPEINFAGSAEATRAEFLTLPTAPRYVATLSLTF